MKASWTFLVFGTAVNVFMVVIGTLWCLAPRKFVSTYRSVLFTDKTAKTVRWEEAVCSVSGRIFAALLLVFGFIGLWILYSPFRSK
jgi:hypothetical protein